MPRRYITVDEQRQVSDRANRRCEYCKSERDYKDIEVLLHQQAANAGYKTVSEYLADLIMREQERLSQQARIEALLIEGLDSGEPIELTIDAK